MHCHEQPNPGDTTPIPPPDDLDLLNRIIADVAYLDAHHPPPPMLWLLAHITDCFAEFVRWREAKVAEEQTSSPSDSSP